VLLAGDWLAAALWSGSLWFCSPLQLLLLFLGQIETERPSDWAMGILGRASGLPYAPPLRLNRFSQTSEPTSGDLRYSSSLELPVLRFKFWEHLAAATH
jgi:hypothetical protein